MEQYDFIIDAIDSLKDKADLILRATALPKEITFISSMGAALRMFCGCTSLKISDQKTKEFPYKWRLPIAGDIDGLPENWNTQTLTETGWPFTSDPQANTTYYVAQPPIATAI